jgi:quinol-cytochrome oxidoreductase complex cytochrome b subunit
MSSKNTPDHRHGFLQQVWRSVFPRPLVARTDRERASLTRFTFLLHLRPVQLPARTLRWTHTFGLGGSSLVLVAALAATGILTMLVYQPVPDVAYDSVSAIEGQVAFGSLVRGVHYWSANLLVVVVLLHLARVFFTGGHHGARQFNWVIGSALLLCVLASNFTGYLLPWDQLSYWAVTISTGMLVYLPGIGPSLRHIVLGGSEIGPGTLTNFYTIHTTIVPVCLILLMGFHFWRVRRAGGVVVPPAARDEDDNDHEKVLFLPNLLWREVSQALVLLAVVIVLAALFGAPLGERANPGMSPNPAKSPWYFVGFQELLIHFHPTFAVLIIPALAAACFVLLPYLTSSERSDGTWFLSTNGRRTAILAASIAVVATPALVLIDEVVGAGPSHWFSGGLLPLSVLVGAAAAFALLVKRRYGATTNEWTQAVVVLFAVSFAVLTMIGIWFRGEGMALTWPWTG